MPTHGRKPPMPKPSTKGHGRKPSPPKPRTGRNMGKSSASASPEVFGLALGIALVPVVVVALTVIGLLHGYGVL